MKFADVLRSDAAKLAEQRDALVAELDAIASTCEAETRSANAEEDTRATEIGESLKVIAADIKAKEARAAELDAVEEARATAAKAAPQVIRQAADPFDIELRSAPRTAEVTRDIESRARRALDAMRLLSDDQKSLVEARMNDRRINRGGAMFRHLLATGSDEYRAAFAKLIGSPQPFLTERQAHLVEEARALTAGTDASGGYAMPFTLDPTLIDINAGVANPIRQLARIRTTMTDNWQGVTSAGVTASWDAESSEVSDDTPTLAQPAVSIKHPRAFVPFTLEHGDDLDSVLSDLGAEFGRAKDRLESAAFATGASGGDNAPGIVTLLVAASKTVASAGADTYAVADLYSTQNALPDRFDDQASWLMNKSVINLTRQFGTADSHAMLTHLGDGQPPLLLGAPLHRWSSLDGSITAAADNYVAIYGDIAETYTIVDRLGMTVELVPMLFATANNLPNGQRGLYARWRVGAGLTNADAARVLNVT